MRLFNKKLIRKNIDETIRIVKDVQDKLQVNTNYIDIAINKLEKILNLKK